MVRAFYDYKVQFNENAFSDDRFDGLCYSLRTAFSVIPVAIGHFIDRAFGFRRLFFSDKFNQMNGPFAALLGFFPWLLGATIGFMTQQILQLPMRIGQFIDWGLTRLTNYPFNRIMLGQGGNQDVSEWTAILETIFNLYGALTRTPPKPMRGVGAFMLGALPQLFLYGFDRMTCWFSIIVQCVCENMCDALLPANTEEPPKPMNDSSNKRRPRFKRPQAAKDNENDVQRAQAEFLDDIAFAQQKNLLQLLGIKKEEFTQAKSQDDKNQMVNKQYRKCAIGCHPDKKAGQENEFTQITKARDILLDPKRCQAIHNYL